MAMLFSQQLQFVFASKLSLLFVLFCFIGLLGWLSYMALTQRRLLKKVLMRDDLPEIFRKFKEDLASGK